MAESAKILIYDIESFPHEGWTWRKWKQNVIEFTQEGMICSIAWKWLHDKRVECISLPDFPGYRQGKDDNTKLLRRFHKVISKADITVAHNGIDFDEKYLFGEFFKRGIEPPPPHKVVDTLLAARKKFRFPSNSLNDLALRLGVGRKLKHTGFDLWKGCMFGDMASWHLMVKYNIMDVRILERIYLKMLPWIDKHPDLSNYTRNWNCPVCESPRIRKGGWMYNQASKRQRYICNACGKWFVGPTVKAKKPWGG